MTEAASPYSSESPYSDPARWRVHMIIKAARSTFDDPFSRELIQPENRFVMRGGILERRSHANAILRTLLQELDAEQLHILLHETAAIDRAIVANHPVVRQQLESIMSTRVLARMTPLSFSLKEDEVTTTLAAFVASGGLVIDVPRVEADAAADQRARQDLEKLVRLARPRRLGLVPKSRKAQARDQARLIEGMAGLDGRAVRLLHEEFSQEDRILLANTIGYHGLLPNLIAERRARRPDPTDYDYEQSAEAYEDVTRALEMFVTGAGRTLIAEHGAMEFEHIIGMFASVKGLGHLDSSLAPALVADRESRQDDNAEFLVRCLESAAQLLAIYANAATETEDQGSVGVLMGELADRLAAAVGWKPSLEAVKAAFPEMDFPDAFVRLTGPLALAGSDVRPFVLPPGNDARAHDLLWGVAERQAAAREVILQIRESVGVGSFIDVSSPMVKSTDFLVSPETFPLYQGRMLSPVEQQQVIRALLTQAADYVLLRSSVDNRVIGHELASQAGILKPVGVNGPLRIPILRRGLSTQPTPQLLSRIGEAAFGHYQSTAGTPRADVSPQTELALIDRVVQGVRNGTQGIDLYSAFREDVDRLERAQGRSPAERLDASPLDRPPGRPPDDPPTVVRQRPAPDGDPTRGPRSPASGAGKPPGEQPQSPSSQQSERGKPPPPAPSTENRVDVARSGSAPTPPSVPAPKPVPRNPVVSEPPSPASAVPAVPPPVARFRSTTFPAAPPRPSAVPVAGERPRSPAVRPSERDVPPQPDVPAQRDIARSDTVIHQPAAPSSEIETVRLPGLPGPPMPGGATGWE